ncbi:MAG: hemagglutinin repeat-containing protein [Acetobacter fabarum]|uniref:two-partner secretion domain-containing protein n=1 Tax=Acetobacter fabarum TaxID=483199 RepID=UPI0039E83D3D
MNTAYRHTVLEMLPNTTLMQRCLRVLVATCLLFTSTISVASAQQAEPQIVIDPHAAGPEPTLDKTQNGIDQVNIATPNTAGVSHNDFLEYGVPERGVILNNATSATETKIGGAVYGNSNLNGHSANLILNEVTGSLPTLMLGYTEVAGHQASVVVANPNGITCSGCGFINTARVTLATGKPEMDASGALKDIAVRGGNITFSGPGGDFTTVPVLDVLSRSVTLKAQVNAQTANIVAGRNRVDYGTNVAHTLASDGTATPEFAIDTAALGGLYSNRIYMVVNEAGAGVRVDGAMAANAGDMTLTDTGDLVLNGNLAASGTIQVQASGQITNAGSLQSGTSLQLEAANALANSGSISAGTALTAQAETIGNSGTISAGGGMLSLAAQGLLTNSGGIGASNGSLSARAASIANTGTIASKADLTLNSASSLSNVGGKISNTAGLASIEAVGVLDNTGGTVLNQSGNMILSAQDVTNNEGVIQAGGNLTAALGSYSSNAHSFFTAEQALAVTVSGNLDNEGTLGGSTDVLVTADSLTNAASGLLLATGGSLSLNVGDRQRQAANDSVLFDGVSGNTVTGTVSNTGMLYSAGGMSLTSTGAFSNDNGTIRAGTDLRVSSTALNNTYGKLLAGHDLGINNSITSAPLSILDNNNGLMQAGNNLDVETTSLTNTAGTLLGINGDVTLAAGSTGAMMTALDNTSGGIIQAGGTVSVAASTISNDAGSVLALNGDIALNAVSAPSSVLSFSNVGGAVKAAGNLILVTGNWRDDANGVMSAGKNLSVQASEDLRTEGVLVGGQGLYLDATGLTNAASGLIATENGTLDLVLNGTGTGEGLSNSGRIETTGTGALLNVTTQGSITNSGTLVSQGDVALTAQDLSNSGQVGSLTGQANLTAASLLNTGRLVAAEQVNATLTGSAVNTGLIYGTQGINLKSGEQIDNTNGRIGANGTIAVSGASLTNTSGDIITGVGALLVSAAGGVSNEEGVIQAAGDVTLTAASLDNENAGKIISNAGTLNIQNIGGQAMTLIANNKGALQAENNIVLVANNLNNGSGALINAVNGGLTISAGGPTATAKINNAKGTLQSLNDLGLTVASLDNDGGSIIERSGTRKLLLTNGGGSAVNDFSDAGGILQAAGDLKIDTTSLDGASRLVAGRNLDVTVSSDLSSDTLFQSGGDARLTVAGNYTAASGGGLSAGGNASILATAVTNNGALMANGGVLDVASDSAIFNTGLIDGGAGVTLELPGTLTNQLGAILSQNGSIGIGANNNGPATAVINRSGEIAADSADGDVRINAGSVTNDVLSGVSVANNKVLWSQNYGGSSNVNIIVPQGLLNTTTGLQGTGQLVGHANGGTVYVEEDGGLATLNNAASLISAGRDIDITTTGGIVNDASHISAGRDINLSGGSLNNVGYAVQHVFYVTCRNFWGCSWSSQSDPAFTGGTTAAKRHKKKLAGITIGHYWTAAPQPKEQWGSTETYYGPTGTIVAKDNIVGDFTGAINNQTKIVNASPSEYTTYTGKAPGGLSPLASTSGANSVATNTTLEGAGKEALATATGVLAYQGVETAQVKASSSVQEASMTLPGFAGSSDPTVPNVIASIPGGSALFIPDPNPAAHYLIETNPNYAALSGLYGSQYLLNRLGNNTADYQFLGDANFDTEFIQQQIVAATGQTFLGSSYETSNQQMALLLDNAASESNTLGLTFGTALTTAQQAALTQNIVWYVPETVNGKTVLTPRLYLAPGQATLSDGAEITAANVTLAGSDVNNTGTLSATAALVATASSGDIVNAGGSISGGSVTLAALNGSVINEDQLNTFMVNGGAAQSIGAQGNISSGGNAQISAAQSITFNGGSLNALGDASLVAGKGITLNSVAAQASEDIEGHDYSHRASQTENFGSSISTGGDLTAAALGGNLTLAGAGVTAGKSATLMATGNVDLNTVTDSQSSYTRTVEHGFLNKTTKTQSESSTDQIGNTIVANDNVTMVSGKDMSVAGTIAGGGNVALQAGGKFTENALQSTAQSFYKKESKGFYFDTAGAKAHVGYGKSKETVNDSSITWKPSMIATTDGNLSIAANDQVAINASDVAAAKNLDVTGSSVAFNALSDVSTSKQTSDFKFIGVQVGLSDTSLVGRIANLALSAAQTASDKDMASQSLGALSTAESGVSIGKTIATLVDTRLAPTSSAVTKANIELVGVQAEVGFEHNRKTSQTTSMITQGATANAGNGLTITATGTNPALESNAGDIIATAARLSGKTVTLVAPGNIQLQSGQNSTHTVSSQTTLSAFIGATASLNADLQWGVSVTGQLNTSHSHTNSQSRTQVDTTVSGTQNVTIENGTGTTTLDGAKISGGSVDVTAGNLNITSAQNTASYLSTQESAGVSFAVPVYGTGGEMGFSVNAASGFLYDTYASTEASGLSGLYAGGNGLNVTVAHNTTLNAGVMESTAASGNTVTTGSLTAHGKQNKSEYAGASASISYGNLSSGGNTGPMDPNLNTRRKTFDGNLNVNGVASALIDLQTSTSQSAISSNITVHSGSTSGTLFRDPASANHALNNNFEEDEAGEILSLTNSFENSARNAYHEPQGIQKMITNKSLTDEERAKNDAK